MYLNNFEWTEKQNEFLNLNKTGKFVLKACPGSGKTTVVTERLYQFIKNWRQNKTGIAVLSFTNVAANEIKENYEKKEPNLKIQYPHYIGTLDSFINNYIFLPYGQLVMGCDEKPILVGEPFNYWSSNNFIENQFVNVNFLVDGEVKHKYNLDIQYDALKQMKYDLTKKGFATQKDAIYHSMNVLIQYPEIAKAISSRFPHIIIDEAQDTSDIHMKIFDLLIENGLKNIILVGDSEQAIYQWNGAKPQLFNDKYNEWIDDSIVLNENFRSSQKICDFFSKLSELDYIKSKCSHESDLEPKICGYEDYDGVLNDFFKECGDNKIDYENDDIAILFRDNDDVNIYKNSFKISNLYKLFGYDSENRIHTINIIKGLIYWNNGDYLEGFQILEKEYLKLNYNTFKISNINIYDEIKKIGFYNHRKNVYNFIKWFPPISDNQTIYSWIQEVNEKGTNMNFSPINNKYQKNAYEITFNLLFDDINYTNQLDFYIGTIHSVKGNSYDAVLVILKNSVFGSDYRNILKDLNLKNNEELRIIYVALSRPKKLLYLAVPKEDCEMWNSVFF